MFFRIVSTSFCFLAAIAIWVGSSKLSDTLVEEARFAAIKELNEFGNQGKIVEIYHWERKGTKPALDQRGVTAVVENNGKRLLIPLNGETPVTGEIWSLRYNPQYGSSYYLDRQLKEGERTPPIEIAEPVAKEYRTWIRAHESVLFLPTLVAAFLMPVVFIASMIGFVLLIFSIVGGCVLMIEYLFVPDKSEASVEAFKDCIGHYFDLVCAGAFALIGVAYLGWPAGSDYLCTSEFLNETVNIGYVLGVVIPLALLVALKLWQKFHANVPHPGRKACRTAW